MAIIMQIDDTKGKIIVIDGLDGSGKSTQAKRVYDALKQKDDKVLLISYPDYENPSSALVRMYLNGDFSLNADDVNAYAASSFYAVDRYASYKQFWQKHYREGYTIIASRYVTSNAIHQMVKLPKSQWDSYLTWLDDFEYHKLGLPKPNITIFLDMPRAVANALIQSRYQGDESKKDIHEINLDYLEKCQQTAYYAADKQQWKVVACASENQPYPMQTITDRVLAIINEE